MTPTDPDFARPPDPEADPGETIAALDLGSNSFHMIVARYAGNRLMVLDRLKDMVRLAAGLDRNWQPAWEQLALAAARSRVTSARLPAGVAEAARLALPPKTFAAWQERLRLAQP
jgi:hypothetical protein